MGARRGSARRRSAPGRGLCGRRVEVEERREGCGPAGAAESASCVRAAGRGGRLREGGRSHLVEQDVRCHQHWVVEEADRDALCVGGALRLLLVLDHLLEPAHRRGAVEHPPAHIATGGEVRGAAPPASQVESASARSAQRRATGQRCLSAWGRCQPRGRGPRSGRWPARAPSGRAAA